MNEVQMSLHMNIASDGLFKIVLITTLREESCIKLYFKYFELYECPDLSHCDAIKHNLPTFK